MKTYLCVYFGSACLALLATPAVIWLSHRINALDYPGIRATHTRPTPRIGGVAIFFSAMCLIISVLFLNNAIGDAFRDMRLQLTTMWFMALFIFLVGLADDLQGLPARTKLATELIAACVLCVVGVRITALEITDALVLNLGWISYPLTIVWVIGITNAVNLSDGLDGLAAGISAIACGVIALFAVYSGNVVMAVVMLALLGSLSGFLFFNFNPAKVFMGDCGSLFLGFTIASSSVMCLTKSSALVGLTLPILALGIPIFDTFLAMLRRFLQRRSLFAPDRSHFHHRLVDLGLRQRHAVIVIYMATCMAAGLGMFMMVRRDAYALVILGCILFLLALLFRVVGAVRFRETLIRLHEKHAVTKREKEERRTFEYLQLCFCRTRDLHDCRRAVCEAARQLSFAWVSLHVTNGDGNTNTCVWRQKSVPAGSSRIVTMSFPLSVALPGRSVEFEIAVFANGSLESASHRAALFSRLMDEHASSISRTVADLVGRDGGFITDAFMDSADPVYRMSGGKEKLADGLN